MRISIRTKLFMLLSGLTTIIVLGALVVITQTVSSTIEQKVLSDFNKTRSFFAKQQRLIYDRLVESCYLIGENSTFKANVELQDPGTVYFSVQEFSNYANVDLFIVTDKNGNVLARFGQPGRSGYSLHSRPSVARALKGVEPDFEPAWAELWAMDEKLYQVATVPLYYTDRLIGTISLGTRITRHEAIQLKGESNVDITLVMEDAIIGSTLTDSTENVSRIFNEANISRHRDMLRTVAAQPESPPPFTMQLQEEEVYAFMSPLGAGEAAYYLATIPKRLELRILEELRANILLTGLIALVLTMLLAFILGRTFSRPILSLVHSMNRAKEGEFNQSIQTNTRDEIGLLTQSFNEMMVGMRERLHLMRYVGSHTREMIKNMSHEEVSLGGDRKLLAVLFSDIRGFTQFSEQRLPEEVVTMLNRYLGMQAETVTRFGGSVDKFVGDEMVALFGGDDAVERALDCAVAIQQLMREENRDEQHPIHIGIGINYGSMILGNMGAKERMDYTIIGSAVNLGARLCAAAEAGKILIRRELLQYARKPYRTGNTQTISLKGISDAIQVAEVLA